MSAEEWNERYPEGTRVHAWPGPLTGRRIDTRTRSEAWALGDGTPVVMVEGIAGGIALSHVRPLPRVEWTASDGETAEW